MDEALALRLKTLRKRAEFMKGAKASAQTVVEDLEEQVLSLTKETSKLGKVQLVLSKLVDNMVREDLLAIDKLVNYGLHIVFPDRNLLFKTEMVPVDGKMQVKFSTLDEGKPVADDTYGSVSVVQSVLLRVLCLMKMTKCRLLLLDETFSALDNDYIQRIGVLLKELATQARLDILFVTFNGVVSDANRVLRARLDKKNRELSITAEVIS